LANIDRVIDPIPLAEGVTLRLVEVADAERLAAAYRRNREHLAPWDPSRKPEFFTGQWQAREIPKQLAAYSAGTSVPLVLVTDEAIVGRINLSNIVRGALESGSVGYWIDADYAGRGLVSAALGQALALARGMGLHRIEAGTLVHNVASQRVLEKAGFEYYGMAPKFLKINGSWQDHRLFQILLHD
jgi:ribosomal-protein-alanine N-acetyltransferase